MSQALVLPAEIFKTVVENTPLISIDLVVKDQAGRVLLGKRTNRPAQGYWFVPGGRICKGESFQGAFERLLQVELGISLSSVTVAPLGIYQHFYDDNFSGKEFSTHYVVLAYELQLKEPLNNLPNEQHSDYQWMSVNELLSDPEVHAHSQWYFLVNKAADSSLT